ncbi:GIY-YIG nuclease family protein [Holdemanella biformis]|uniref:GIY-YIG nuclease family protein n=1 Tax=Holdemanella biformis TaxID=1735 RepID=UPI00242D0909|nr:GIY-YIG nuclease family protein [Holdemanella biformis]MBS6259222.1 GIY-YIG nuclease family protein [Holdemanella biformis]
MKGTDEIRTYSFDNDGLNELKSFEYGKNWPVVYLIHNNKDLYIGETTSAEVRMSQHLSNNEKNYLEEIAIVFDHKFNKSVILDYEQRLIKYGQKKNLFPPLGCDNLYTKFYFRCSIF